MLKRSLLLISLTLLSTSCALIPDAHRIEITQGNIIEQESIDKLSLGMTEEQVKFLMGSPAIQDIFHPDRWDYIHYVDRQRRALVNQQLTLVFKDGLLEQAKSKDFDVSKLASQTAPVTAPAVVAISGLGSATETVTETATEPSIEDNVKSAVQNWAAAWSQQNVDAYVTSYVDNYNTGSSHSAWAAQRKTKLTHPKSIAIGIEDLEVMTLDETTARAEFKQDYRSNTYQDQVLKQMTLTKQGDSWKISAEKTLKKLK